MDEDWSDPSKLGENALHACLRMGKGLFKQLACLGARVGGPSDCFREDFGMQSLFQPGSSGQVWQRPGSGQVRNSLSSIDVRHGPCPPAASS